MSRYIEALEALMIWYHGRKRVLPWRSHPNVYPVWISEIMLQQTQVKTVIPYFEKFIARFPDVKILAAASIEDVTLHWAGLGYYSRARNLHKASQIIAAQGFPKDRAGWEKLPGVGSYTAGAVLSIAMGQPEAILDANVKRIISRLRLIPINEKQKQKFWNLSGFLVQSAFKLDISPSDFNQALMELGAMVCLSGKPNCESCPFKSICRAYQRNQTAQYPQRVKKEWVTLTESDVYLVTEDNKLLLKQRAPGEWRSGLWDLPSHNPFPESIQIICNYGEIFTRHTVTNHKITRTTQIFKVQIVSTVNLPQEYRWVDAKFPEAKTPLAASFIRCHKAAQAQLESSNLF